MSSFARGVGLSHRYDPNPDADSRLKGPKSFVNPPRGAPPNRSRIVPQNECLKEKAFGWCKPKAVLKQKECQPEMVFRKNGVNSISNLTAPRVNFFSTRQSGKIENLVDEIFCLMVQNPSGKEKKSKLTSLKIHCAKNFYSSGREFLLYALN
ncbi:hypothetical protein HQ47_00660 [Porphyromonas macacae]|uniref:Uncharacterized protein n=1 Tax=Porphyromonas macacae TaxID=28115 RepID=A0A0A2EBQ0_9PORP|nr:hypothetical protein HQ47_00660 [Porphyromonas macacae]